MENPTDIEVLEQHFINLSFPKDAISWLIMIYNAFQVFDDYADGDNVERIDLNALIWNTLIAIPQNSFYLKNSFSLSPILSTAILKWQGSDTAEREGNADARSFVWRAGYYDLVLTVGNICHGADWSIKNAHIIMGMYGEKLEDYLKEFKHA
jgi:hypothetical protein